MEFQKLSEQYPQFPFQFYSREELNIQDKISVRNIFEKVRPRYVINCAAYTAVDKAETDKETAFLVNATAVESLARQAAIFNIRLIHFSTDYVFDGNKRSPYQANDMVSPETIYGASKAEGERLAVIANRDAMIIRTSWVYSSYGKNFVKTMLRLMDEKEEIQVVNDQFGCPTYAFDLAETILQIISSVESGANEWRPGIYHYCNSGVITWYQFAVAIKELAGKKCNVLPITSEQFPTVAKRPSYSALDCAKINVNYGVRQKEWRESLKKCLLAVE